MAVCEKCGNVFKAKLAGYITEVHPKTRVNKILKVCPECKGKSK
jgi:rubredoxin